MIPIRRRKTPTTGLKKDADAIRQKIEREMNDRVHVPHTQSRRISDVGEEWLKECDRRHRVGDKMSGNTLNKYSRYYRIWVMPNFGHIKLCDLDRNYVQDVVNRDSLRCKRNTMVCYVSALKHVIQYGISRKYLVADPLVHSPIRLQGKKKRQIPVPTRSEILEYCTHRPKREDSDARFIRTLALTLALFSGLRRGEILGLQWSNIDFDEKTIRVRHSLSYPDGLKDPKSEAGVRNVPMADPVFKTLAAWHELQGCPGEGFVVLRNGRPLKTQKLTLWVLLLIREMGMVDKDGRNLYSLHTLRHAAISLLIDLGLNAMHIKEIVGHSKVTTTLDVYGHLMPEDSRGREAFATLSRQFESLPTPARKAKNATKTRLLEKTSVETAF